ncbi:hypothetical protein PS718_02393 [Pseudomonas fluorescens]|uniref:Uncharacterized protein n=1 Tax=Pseudomonas fluorescens TaxID=294 RepID=A0A5E7C5B6_PSEFL|nr:hypothetical protein PS718_02393 [Pseudomonas fluorescens]
MQLTYPKAPSNGVQTLRPALQTALQTQGFGANRQRLTCEDQPQ